MTTSDAPPLAATTPAFRRLLGRAVNAAVTLTLGVALAFVAYGALSFLIFGAAWSGDVSACRATEGACWPFVGAKLKQFVFGRYPDDELWRAAAAMLLPPALLLAAFLARRRFGLAGFAAAVVLGLPLAFLLVAGDGVLLAPVSTDLWGGLTLTLLVSYTGIAASLPLGIVLALMRRSSWPVPRWLAICFIEFWRGVPLVTVLFMAAVMLPLFLPEGASVNKLARALFAIAVFASAYMAEVIRGGLQSVPENQVTAGRALGLRYSQILALVILPQAIRSALPGIAGTFIGLLKDTTLVLVIGLFDFLGMIQLAAADPAWSASTTTLTGYAFAALVFWSLCYAIARVSAYLERVTAESRR
ncbi:amino acid ABC transporter permease [Rhodomicrobium udaipurense]|uniref:Amino acid ABC transporter permease n=2 Tax=Rhodomicrobium udaipurense TaxID=1202716 RepID=A0A8I1KJU2_9HYPH|nr:amino acid ABC transporter permease [Rhodomicrobium udaipurense]MBJ7543341.1 amino acid ABC transporter permease [Rhodomicrobium udaipurense]